MHLRACCFFPPLSFAQCWQSQPGIGLSPRPAPSNSPPTPPAKCAHKMRPHDAAHELRPRLAAAIPSTPQAPCDLLDGLSTAATPLAHSLYREVYIYFTVLCSKYSAYPGLYSHSTVLTLRHCTVQPHDRTEVHLYGTVLYSTAVASATGYCSRSTGTRAA